MAQMSSLASTGGYGKEILIDSNELNEIIKLITNLEVSFHTVLIPKLKALSETKYYEGGDAAEMLKHYGEMINKVNEVMDLYSRANGEVFYLMMQWIEQDSILAKSFYESLKSDHQFAENLNILLGGNAS